MAGAVEEAEAAGEEAVVGEGEEGARWWDAEWREAKLASIRGSQTQLDEAAVKQQMLELRASQKTEAVLGEGYSREDQSRIIQLAASLRLHCKAYGSGARRTLVASKEELPNYRPEFDRRTPQHTIGIDPRAQDAVRRAIQQMDALAPPPPLPVRRAGVPGPRSGAAVDNSDVGPRRPGAMIGPQRPAASPIGPHRPPASSPGPARAAAAADGVAALWSDADASGEGSDADDLNEDLRTATSPGQLPGSSGARADAEVNLRLQEQQRRQQESEAVRKMLEFRRKLPAFNMRQQLLRAVAGGQVLVVSGETGCGKTTQLPQFILEEAIEAGRGSECSIVCTQPRRISAISVAERVAAERGEKVGEAVGYQIRLEAEMSASTRLLFCTTGILLRRLVADPKLTGVSHVVVDEIHERGMYEDFLLIILRDMLPARPDLKLILMSATLNADRFAAYFGGCPTAHIPGFTHPVEDLFLEHILQHSNIRIASPEPASGGGSKGRRGGRQRPAAAGGPQQGKPPYMLEAERYRDLTPAVQASMRHWAEAALEGGSNNGKPDLDLVGNVVSWICTELPEGAVLVFLTGWDDIKKLHEMLENRPVTGDRSRVRLLPLHGSMPTVNQRVIFDRPPPGVRKVVLATNIAETSITIDDIVYVVDTGKSKQKTYDPLNQLARLLPDWTSKASVKQRRGRAGRLQPGLCLHLFPQHMHDSWMDQYQLPELQRTPLEGLCLQIKSLQLGGVESFLNKAMDPPDSRSVVNALRLLTDIGALDSEERLTALGHHLAALPVDPLIGKMIVFGAVFDVLDPILTIAAGISYRDPFVLPMDKKEEADTARQRLAGDTRSDHFAILNAFEGFLQQKATGGHRAARDYCFRNFLSMNTLEMMSDMRKQFAELLQGIGFLRAKGLPENASLQQLLAAHSHQCDNSDLIRAVMCSGMFPNVVSVHQKKRRATLLTATDGTVKAHPSSVNAVERFFPHRWLVYSAKVQTSDVFVQASTMVSDYALLLFGGQVRESADAPGQVTMLNGFITFTAEPQVVHTILDLKSRLQGLLQHKIRNPALDITDAGSPLIHALLALLQSEPEANQMHRSLYSRRGERDDDNDDYRSFSRARDDNGW